MQNVRRLLMVLVGALAFALYGSAPSAQTQTQTHPRPATPSAAAHVTTPMQEWGHNIGDDYFLVDYQQLITYWHKLEKQSPRVHIVDIGKSSEGRPMLMAIVTAPENYAKLAHYKDITSRLANAEGLTDAQARALAKEGKSVVWIDGGLHATETLGAQQLLEHVYQMATRTDEETMRFLRDTIQLCTLVNPDGMDLVSDWYMKRGNMSVPVLYNKYVGHDDNRDFYMSGISETTNINEILYREWYPQIVYNHHQAGPAGTVMFSAPFRDPYNYFQHPAAISGIDTVGALMQERFMMEGKPGVTERKGASYSTWFNGGLRTTAHFHNMIGILTETIGNPTPMSIPFVANKQIGDSSIYWPIAPQQVWHFRQSIDYSITADRAIVDYASRYRERVLYDIYRMGHDEIQWGSEDHWTFTPHRMAKVQDDLIAKGVLTAATASQIPGAASTMTLGGRGGGGGGRGGGGNAPNPLYEALRAKDLCDARGYIIPSDQSDFGTATKFVNALIKTGISVMKATAPFTVAGKQYPANSYVVKTAQAFRPHVLDMFESQDYPDDIPYPGGPPTAPYDTTGYTLAYTMGVQFDRVLDAFDGPFQKISGFAKVPAAAVPFAASPSGYYFSHKANDSFIVVNRLLKAGEDVSWLANGPMGAGTFYVAAKSSTMPILQKAAAELGITFQAATSAPSGAMAKLKPLRIGLFDRYGGIMPTGWTRKILENFEFPGFDEKTANLVFPPDLDAGNLHAKYDVLIFNGGGLGGAGGGRGGAAAGGDAPPTPGGDVPPAGATGAPAGGRGGGRGAGRGGAQAAPAQPAGRGNFTPEPIPAEFARRQGQVTDQTTAQIKQFVQDGGTVIAIGTQATGFAQAFGLPVTNHLMENGTALPREKFYAPGCVLQLAIDNTNPLAHGLDNKLDVFFENDPVFAMGADAAAKNTKSVGWFASAAPARSGWAWGQQYLDKGVEIISSKVGQGRVVLLAPEVLFRSQPHGSYKLFFNGMYLSVAQGLE
jgi:hypothetical protein